MVVSVCPGPKRTRARVEIEYEEEDDEEQRLKEASLNSRANNGSSIGLDVDYNF